jgi:hypothetical protein
MIRGQAVGRRFALATVSLLAVAVLFAPPGRAAEVTMFSSTGGALVADFNSVDASGCVSTSVSVNAGETTQKTKPDGTTVTVPSAFVFVFQFNSCTSDFLYASAVSQDLAFSIDKGSLKGGTLSGTMDICGASSTSSFLCFSIAVNLTWTATGPLDKTRSMTRDRSGDITVINRFKGSSRDASASGTVYSGTLNLAPSASTTGFMAYTTAQTVTIEH